MGAPVRLARWSCPVAQILLLTCVWSSVIIGGIAKKYNIVLSLADDLGYWDVGYQNDGKVYSPTIDKLANDGIRFDRLYMARFCSPSRSLLLSGIYPHKYGQQTDLNFAPPDKLPCGLQTSMTLLPSILSDANYSTHAIGKWHLGYYERKFVPVERGFDSFLGYYTGGTNHMQPGALLREVCMCKLRKKAMKSDAVVCANEKATQCTTVPAVVNSTRGGEIRAVSESVLANVEYSDWFFADEAERIIRNHDTSRPLFLFLSWASPHAPIESPTSMQDLNVNMSESLGNLTCLTTLRLQYAGMVSALDKAIAQVVNALQFKGMWEDTIFIFISDNGGHDEEVNPQYCGTSENHRIRAGRNFPLRGGKFTSWEGGVRTLGYFYSNSTNIIPVSRRGGSYNGLFSGVDVPATLLSIIGLDRNNTALGEDGVDQWQAILSNGSSPRTELPVQLFAEAARYAFLWYDEDNDRILKYIRGYPGKIESAGGYMAQTKYIPDVGDLGDRIVIPDELLSTDPQYNATFLAEVKRIGYPSCWSSFCLFDVTNDPSELYDLSTTISDETLLKIRLRIREHKTSVVPFYDSNLCFPFKKSVQKKMKYRNYVDPNAAVIVEKCDGLFPWRTDDDAKIKVSSPDACQ